MARGGYRPNSGPKKGTKYKKRGTTKKSKPKKSTIPEDIVVDAKGKNLTPLEYMLKVMNDPEADDARRDRMATYAAPYIHPRKGEGGKKAEQEERAKKAAKGRFASLKAPQLKAIK